MVILMILFILAHKIIKLPRFCVNKKKFISSSMKYIPITMFWFREKLLKNIQIYRH